MKKIEKIITGVFEEKYSILEQFLHETLKKVKPEIKGEITKGKLKRRGISLETHSRENNQELWIIKQKDKIIDQALFTLDIKFDK